MYDGTCSSVMPSLDVCSFVLGLRLFCCMWVERRVVNLPTYLAQFIPSKSLTVTLRLGSRTIHHKPIHHQTHLKPNNNNKKEVRIKTINSIAHHSGATHKSKKRRHQVKKYPDDSKTPHSPLLRYQICVSGSVHNYKFVRVVPRFLILAYFFRRWDYFCYLGRRSRRLNGSFW